MNRRVVVSIFLGFALCAVLAIGQSTGTGTPASGNKPTPANPTSTNVPTPSKPTVDPNFKDPLGANTPGISGRLVPSTGARTQVDLFENGMRIDTTFSNSDGSFHFQRALSGQRYEIRVALGPDTEYREEQQFQPGYPNVITINNQSHIFSTNPDRKAPGGMISVANLSAPKKAVAEMEKGRDLGIKKKYEEAMQHLQKAVDIYAKYPEAYNEMGLLERSQQHNKEAEEMFQKSIDADPKWTAPYLNLAQVQMNTANYPELVKTTDKVLQLDPSLAPAHFYGAVGYLLTGDIDRAEKEALAAEISAVQIPQVHLILGNIYEVKGNATEAVARYKLYLKVNPTAVNAAKLTQRIAELERQ